MSIISYLMWIISGLGAGVAVASQPYVKRSKALCVVIFAIAIGSVALTPPPEAYFTWGASALAAFAVLWQLGVAEKCQLK